MPEPRDNAFAALLEREGPTLASFVLALVGNPQAAEDVYQSTCLELWRIRSTFRMGSDFGAWSRTVARYQIRRHWKRTRREKLVFSAEAMELIENAYKETPREEEKAERLEALKSCLDSLEEESHGLVEERYGEGASIRQLALRHGVSEDGLKMRLLRIRRKLAECLRRKTSRLKTSTEASLHDVPE
jgi:RNA polymerase sigma-70 factor (ECF subfamily)